MNVGINFSTRAARQWKRPSGQVVQSPTLEVFKTKMDKALNNLVSWMSLLWAAGWIRDLLRPMPAWIILGSQSPVQVFSSLDSHQLSWKLPFSSINIKTDKKQIHEVKSCTGVEWQSCWRGSIAQWTRLCQASENLGILWERLYIFYTCLYISLFFLIYFNRDSLQRATALLHLQSIIKLGCNFTSNFVAQLLAK